MKATGLCECCVDNAASVFRAKKKRKKKGGVISKMPFSGKKGVCKNPVPAIGNFFCGTLLVGSFGLLLCECREHRGKWRYLRRYAHVLQGFALITFVSGAGRDKLSHLCYGNPQSPCSCRTLSALSQCFRFLKKR